MKILIEHYQGEGGSRLGEVLRALAEEAFNFHTQVLDESLPDEFEEATHQKGELKIYIRQVT